ncbi:MAG: hypothetical protein CBC01_08960, partial [Betaproteobacteria bacterium TMED41]
SGAKNLTISGFKIDNQSYDIKRQIDGKEITNCIFLSGFDNLSHFMMEIAPKSLLLPNIIQTQPEIKNIATSNLVPKKWIDYSVQIAESIESSDFNLNTIQFNSEKAIRFTNLVIITSVTHRGENKKYRMAVEEARNFSKQMKVNSSSMSFEDPYIIYLSRKYASHRRTLNQKNLIKIVKKIYPDFKFILAEKIYEMSMQDQAKLIFNANLVVEEGGGSTGFTSNLIRKGVPYVCITTTQRSNATSSVYLAGLGNYAAWVFGDPVGKLTESPVIDNDIQVNEVDFENLLKRLSLFLQKKIPAPSLQS